MLIDNTPFSAPWNKPRFTIEFRSPVTLAIAISVVLLAFHNMRFWKDTAAAFWSGSVADTLFIGSMFLVLLYVHTTFLLLIPGKRLFRIVVTLLFFIAAMASYSTDSYGVFIDKDMVRNLFETDRREATALLNVRFTLYVIFLGIVPAILLWRVRVQDIGFGRQLLQRLGFMIAGLAVSAGMLFMFSAYYSSFIREHKSLRYLLSPAAAIQGTIQYARSTVPDKEGNRLENRAGATVNVAANSGAKPLLLFLVVGETARAQNFQLGGYSRETNPELAKMHDVLYFNNVTSCGTSTAISLPCMFSHLKRDNFSVALAGRTTNLIDALSSAGFGVEWRDNNSGSKGVSARAMTISYGDDRDAGLCNEESCYDEIMLKDLDKTLRGIKTNTVIAFHQIGSHGPAYTKRYPASFAHFAPVCSTNELKTCSPEQIRNAYDNSIRYTDHNLARQIGMLKTLSDRFDTILIYVSDHGESLGEKGLFLHGAPYMFAPDEQKKVPFVLWMSDGYRRRFSLQDSCLRAQLGKPFSHDNLYHTVLGTMGLKNAIYDGGLDMLASCRNQNSASVIRAAYALP